MSAINCLRKEVIGKEKNKLKVFGGIYDLIIRDFDGAANLFVDVLPTFNCPEVISY
jgi:hypothetical protein